MKTPFIFFAFFLQHKIIRLIMEKGGSMMDKNVIEVKQLSKSFQKTVALQGCDFSVRKGEIFGFLGPSGAGKTTTIKLLTGQ